MAQTASDRNLLFGIIALQMDFISRDVLIGAMHAWSLEKFKSLGVILVGQGALDEAERALLDSLVHMHVKRHDDDVERSLSAMSHVKWLQRDLREVADAELEVSLGRLAATVNGPDVTASLSAGGSSTIGGRFRILRPHARGGQGEVFVARDTELNREVALKQIQARCADHPESRSRFLLEAEVTGSLEHPGVIPVYGLGFFDDGRPFYAMRFIRGDSLKDAIAQFHQAERPDRDPGERSLALRRLLRRFVDACNALAYAHSRGVLHRDLKPGNVMLGPYGETLVVDWGLAKAAGHRNGSSETGERTLRPTSGSASTPTLTGEVIGTPAFMSPEQASGELDRLGPRSDVYSLGATLYCLLTGRPPFENDDVVEILRGVRQGEFSPPRQLDPSIDPALEAICLQAMKHRPEDRYASCRSLADDLDRWMADEPVTAWREPMARRARRWAQRNRTPVTAAAVALAAGVVGLAAVLAVQTRAKAELTRSQAAVQVRYDLAVEAIKTFHTGVSEDFLLKQEQFKGVRDRLLKSASDFYGKLGALLGKESDLASRRALGHANYEVAELTRQVGRSEDALAAHRQVLDARIALAAASQGEPEIKADIGRSLIAIAGLLLVTGRTEDAEATYRKAEALLVEPGPTNSESSSSRLVLANCRSSLGWVLHTTGRNDEALSVYRLARADQESLAAAPAAKIEHRRELAATINGVAALLAATGKTSAAIAENRIALEIQQKLADESPAVTDFRSDLAISHNNLGNLLSDAGKAREAEAEYRQALTLRQRLADDNPAVTHLRSSLARSRHDIANLLWITGRDSVAEDEFRKALAIEQKLVDDNPAVTEYRSSLAGSRNHLGILLSTMGKSSEAEAERRMALALYQRLADSEPPVSEFRTILAKTHDIVAWLKSNSGESSQAESEYREALAIRKQLADDNPAVVEFRDSLAISHITLGWLLSNCGKQSDAEAEFGRALEIRQQLADDYPDRPQFQRSLATSLLEFGWRLAQAGKAGDAIGYYTREESIRQTLAGASSVTPADTDLLANCQTNMADALRRSGRLNESLAACERALAVREPLVEAHVEVPGFRAGLGETLLRLGQVRCDLENHPGAIAAWKRALAHYDRCKSLNQEQTFYQACCHAGLAELAGRPGSGVSAAEGPVRCGEAMATLRQAIAMGFRDVDAYRTESALDSLRKRPEFQFLMMDLAFPVEPFAK